VMSKIIEDEDIKFKSSFFIKHITRIIDEIEIEI